MPFNRGVNLPLWFQVSDARHIQFGKFTKKDFENIQCLGCDVIRIPVNLHDMTNGEPDYNVDQLFYYFMDEVVFVKLRGVKLRGETHRTVSGISVLH